MWKDFKQEKPTRNGRFLVTNGIEVEIGFYFADHELFYDGDGAVVFVPMKRVTHWMELPKAKREE